MKKTGIINAQLIYELTKMRHTDKFMICDVGFPIPEGKTVVDLSLVPGFPTVDQVFKAIANDILIESIILYKGFGNIRPKFVEELKSKFVNHEITEMAGTDMFQRAYEPDVKLFIRTGENRPGGNMIVTSASGVPKVFDKYNAEYDNVLEVLDK